MTLSYKKINYIFKVSMVINVLFILFISLYHPSNLSESKLSNNSQNLSAELESLVIKLSNCNNCTIHNLELNSIINKIDLFQKEASKDKYNYSLVGDLTYQNIILAINKYKKIKNEDMLLKSLLISYVKLSNNNIQLKEKIHLNQIKENENNKKILILTGVSIAIINLISYIINLKYVRNISYEKEYINNEIKTISDEINNLSLNDINAKLLSSDLSKYHRSILSTVLSNLLKIENEKENNDLYKQLYTIIGYEIRNLTTTINGSINDLMEDDLNEKWKNINSLVMTLSDLADNYNQLLSQGNENNNKDYSFLNMISRLLINLNNKEYNKNIDVIYYIDENLPDQVEGVSTNIFWSVLIQISNSLNLHKNKHLFISIESDASDNLEMTRIDINIYFITSTNITIDKIKKSHWINNDALNSDSKYLMKNLMKDHKYFKSNWYKSGKQHLFNVKFDVKAKSFYTPKKLITKRSVVYLSESILQIQTLTNSLSYYNIEVISTKSPKELFNIISNNDSIDAIIISNLDENTKSKPFIKTIKSRIRKNNQTKLILIADNLNSDISRLTDFVDHIFYTPIIHFEFASELLKVLEDDNNTKINDHIDSILIAEDDKVQQIILKKILSKNNYTASTVNNGIEAISYIDKNKPSIVFMDLIMPIMGGVEATKKIREYEKKNNEKSCIIIGVTALKSKDEHNICFEAGMNAVISKPYKNENIIKAIKKYAAVNNIN